MELNEKQYRLIAGLLSVQRGNVKIQNRTLLNVKMATNGGHCRGPSEDGTAYVRLNRRAEKGALERVYTALIQEGLPEAEIYCQDSAAVKAHPDALGVEKKRPAGNREDSGR